MYTEEDYDGEGNYSNEMSETGQPSFVVSTTRNDDENYNSEEDESFIESHMYESPTYFNYKLPDGYIKE